MANFVKSYTPTSNMAKGPVEAGTQLAVGGSAERSSDPNTGELRYNSDNNLLEIYNGTQYSNIALTGNAPITKTTVVTGDGSTALFTSFFATAPVSVNSVLVVVGNVVQEPTQAYTISGTDITFTSAPPVGHRIYGIIGFDSNVAA